MRKFTTRAVAIGAMAVAMVSANAAIAQQNLGELADDFKSQTGQIGDFLGVLAFAVGIFLAFKGIMKFKANVDAPNDPSNKLSSAFVLVFAGAALVALPAVLGVGVTSMLGNSAETTTLESGFSSIR